MENITNLTDQFLIAMPQLNDKYFANSVTYLCEHTDKGAMGIIINQSTDFTLDLIFEQLSITPIDSKIQHHPVFRGGPIQPDRGFILHTGDTRYESSLRVNEQIQVTTSRDILEAIANHEGPPQFIVTLGYAGWKKGQLEQEIADNIWLNGPSDHSIIFNPDTQHKYQDAARLMGINLNAISSYTGHA